MARSSAHTGTSEMRKLGSKVLLISALMCALLLMALQGSLWHWRAAYLQQSSVEIASISPAERSAADMLAARRFIGNTPARPQQFYGYNHTLSDKIGAFRALPDSRNAACERRLHGLPQRDANVSVIIAFHNEARAALLRTIMSVHERSPAQYLHELILVDDYSEDVSLLSQLRQLNFAPFMPAHSATSTPSLTIKMQRNTRRLGLIESRNRGARLASGDYLLFLDSHCEVNVGWLEPLLQRVSAVAGIAVSPLLDSIDAQTLQYHASSMNFMGGFDWNLHFHWVPRDRQEQQQQWQEHWAGEADSHSAMKPFKSPTFAGGIFMISRNWFFKLEAFNSLLEIWGGESIEFSIKLWLCGGQIEIVPCSRVGHIFRRQHPFQFPRSGDGQATYLRNSKIIAESWLDAYKYFFYASKPAAQHIDVEIPRAALARLRRDLQCRPFAWYLQHVFQQLRPSGDEFNACGTLSCGERCLRIMQPSNNSFASPTSQLRMSSCFDVGVTHWNLHRHSALLQSSGGTCLHVLSQQSLQNSSRLAHSTHFALLLQPCQKSAASQQRWQRRGAQLMHVQTHLCLDNPLADEVSVSLCRPAAPTQQFRFSLEVQLL